MKDAELRSILYRTKEEQKQSIIDEINYMQALLKDEDQMNKNLRVMNSNGRIIVDGKLVRMDPMTLEEYRGKIITQLYTNKEILKTFVKQEFDEYMSKPKCRR